jgi:F-type H+-transporting ATPase subunit b
MLKNPNFLLAAIVVLVIGAVGHQLRDPEYWVLVAFVIFFGLFGVRLWREIAKLLDNRADQVRNELTEASRLREEAEKMLAEAREAREAALTEAREVLARSRVEANRMAEAAKHDAEAAAKRREHMALDRIAAAEKAAVNDIRQAAADIAIAAARNAIAREVGPEEGARIIDQAIAELPRALRAA